MHVPGLMDRVRLAGSDEVYVVTRVDYQVESADLLPILNGGPRLVAVPFASMQAVSEKWPRPLPRMR